MLTKIFSAAPPKPLNRSKAWACVAINQLAFPGMGTIMAGRRSGYLQAAIMLAGFFLTMHFLLGCIMSIVQLIIHSQGGEVRYGEIIRPYAGAGIVGLALCVTAWCWALISSIAIVRDATRPPQP